MAMMTSPDPLSVLVVDDHDTFAELLVGALDREVDLVCVGHATTGGEGVAMVDRLGPDVVLMDIQLPDMDGFAATEQILAADGTVRVVMLTAHASAHLVARAARAGACAFLHKTGHLSDVLTTVRTARTGDLDDRPGPGGAAGQAGRDHAGPSHAHAARAGGARADGHRQGRDDDRP